MRADLVLLGSNPLEGLAALRQVRGVVVRGQWLSPERIAAMLERVAAAREGERND